MWHVLFFLLGAHIAYAGKHSLMYVYTGTSGLPNFPDFVTVGIVDGQPFTYYDSNIRRETPRQEWMAKSVKEDYWEQQTQISIGTEQSFINNINVAKERFNHTGGVHTFQQMYGCEWDDQTKAITGFFQFGYDGEDFLTLDLKDKRWISPVQQGITTTQKWNNNAAELQYYGNYFSTECIEWLQKYVKYGKRSLEKTVSPQVSLLQKSSSSPVSCHATGFYPSAIKISWMKNGEDHDEDVDLGELLRNEDGTFQRTSTLNVKPEEWKNNKFGCVVEHQGDTKTETEIRTNRESVSIGLIAGVVVAVLLLVVIGVAGFMMYQKKKGYKPANSSDDGSNSSAQAIPKA